MKKVLALALSLLCILALVSVNVMAATDPTNNPLLLETADAVAKWKKGGNVLGTEYFAAGQGESSSGAMKITGNTAVTTYVCPLCINVPASTEVSVKITAKATGICRNPDKGQTAGGRIALRLATSADAGTVDKPDGTNEKRCYIENPGDGSFTTTETVYTTGSSACLGFNLATFPDLSGTTVYISKIEVTNKSTGVSYLDTDCLDEVEVEHGAVKDKTNNPFNFDTLDAVKKWTNTTESNFNATKGVDGGAIVIHNSGAAGKQVDIYQLKNLIKVPEGANITIEFDMKSNVALGECLGKNGSGTRCCVRLENNDNTRSCVANAGKNKWVHTKLSYVGTADGAQNSAKKIVDKEYTTIEILTVNFNVDTEYTVMIDNLKVYNTDTGVSYLTDPDVLNPAADTADHTASAVCVSVCLIALSTAFVFKKKHD